MIKIIKDNELLNYIDEMSEKEIITSSQQKAIKKLMKLKVFDIMDSDRFEEGGYRSYFDSLWFMAEHELDMFLEGEDTSELTKTSARATKKWIEENKNLLIEK